MRAALIRRQKLPPGVAARSNQSISHRRGLSWPKQNGIGGSLAVLRVILGDQLSPTLSCLHDTDKDRDTMLLCEVQQEATYVKHHKKKLVFIFSAMRHFAQELRDAGYRVIYHKLDDATAFSQFSDAVIGATQGASFDEIVVTEPSEYRVLEEIKLWPDLLNVPVDIRPDTRFLANHSDFETWSAGRKSLRMEYFYREMRKRYMILMDGDQPVGDQWNFDSENRKPPNSTIVIPDTFHSAPDAITQEVCAMVERLFPDHMGTAAPFHFAVTAEAARAALQQFIDERLTFFGDYQDAMLQDEAWMFHAHIGLYLNTGLLLPLECIAAAEQAYHRGQAPLNAVEGFIRQILGWREFVRGLYWQNMPGYDRLNFFDAQRDLPDFYWTADTRMNCLRQSVQDTIDHAYAHHIQRLMVLGNFALLAGILPAQVNDWFLSVYADAFEWVELPNVSGMALFADGGKLASKPYASGGGYINKMSNYCKGCSYSVTVKNGPKACPFNYLYWDFLDRNRTKLRTNPRVGMMYRVYDRMDADKQQAIRSDAKQFFKDLATKDHSL
jgi:deoxyribodipyrimidine photolyase-related protein